MLTRKFGRTKDHRLSLIRNLATSIILFERVTTTSAKAKEMRGVVERLINIGKEGGISNYRRLLSLVFDPKAAKKIMEELAPRYKTISSGYVRVLPLMPRRGDATPMALIELRSITSTSGATSKARKGEQKDAQPESGKGSATRKLKRVAKRAPARKKTK